MHSVRAQDAGPASHSQWVTGAATGFATRSDTDAASGLSADTAPPLAATHFDLPSQPLAEALQAYGRIADLFVMADAALLRTRISSPVSGDYTAHEALQRLLAGTGLDVRFTSAHSAVILPPSAATGPAASTPAVQGETTEASGAIATSMIDGVGSASAYALVIQARLTEALCRSPRTRPGGYRLAVQLFIDDAGAVAAMKLLGSTGDAARDAAIVRAVGALVFDSGPPPTLAQPVTILLRPQGKGIANGCASFDSRG